VSEVKLDHELADLNCWITDLLADLAETRSTGTVHTSPKARLSWLSVVGRWRNGIVVAMAMPASACPALQRRAAQSVDTTFRISQ